MSILLAPIPVAAGYKSPAQDYFYGRIDLNEHLIKDVTSTFVVRVTGQSMEGAGISDGDESIVNRALEPRGGSVVVAVLDGELTVKRLRVTPSGVVLQADNPKSPDIHVPAMSELTIWGRRHHMPAPHLSDSSRRGIAALAHLKGSLGRSLGGTTAG